MMQVMRVMMTAIVVAAMVVACAPLVVGQEAAGDTATPQTPAPQEAAGEAAADGDDDAAPQEAAGDAAADGDDDAAPQEAAGEPAADGDDDAAPQEAAGEAAAAGTDRVTDGLVALYLFDEALADVLISDRVRPADGLELLVRPGEPVPMVALRDGAVHFEPAADGDEAGAKAAADDEIPGVFSVSPAAELVQTLISSSRLTIEAWLTPATDTAEGPARIVSISRDFVDRNITLGQTHDHYILRLRTSGTNIQGWPELEGPEGTLVAGELQHLVVTFDGWTTVMYLDGEPIADTEHFGGTLEGWDDTMPLILGNELTGERLWPGSIHLVAIYSHALTPEQVQTNYEAGL